MEKARWITYMPELKVLDCTIRDGGLVNDSQFTDDQVKAVYEACVEGGLDYMEIGYKNSREQFPTDKFGPWRHSYEEDMRRAVGDHTAEDTGLKLCCMADAGGKSDWKNQIIPRSESVLDMIRVACYVEQISEGIEMVTHAHELGYETCLNIMAITIVAEAEIDQALQLAKKCPADVVVVVDSYGHLYRDTVEHLVQKYVKAVEDTDKAVGMHAHNNLQCAFSNTVDAIINGATRVDSTMMGMGRGAGNCHTEILLSFLRNPKFKLRPVLECVQNTILPIKQQHDWGPSVPYNITGQMNIHPRHAISWRNGETPDDYVAFYDKVMADV